jgi:hypothetical protein
MAKIASYGGSRDPRFVTIQRGGLLDETHHCLLASWAADCAGHVLFLFTARYPDDDRPRRAIAMGRAWSHGEATVDEAREMAFLAHAAAREVSDVAASAAARAAGQAVSTAHMADHELGAAAYAIKAVRLAAPKDEAMLAGVREYEWQREHLPEAIRELVLLDEELRNKKFWGLFVL